MAQAHQEPTWVVAQAAPNARSTFIKKTYAHLAGALLAFGLLEYVLLGPLYSVTAPLAMTMVGSRYGWLIVLGLFMVVGWVADRWARSNTSPAVQYLGLGLYVVAEAIIFLPLLLVAMSLTSASVIPTAAIMTICLFVGLTGTVFITGKDFSFLRGILMIGGLLAMGLIVCAIIFGFQLGTIFSVVMIAFAGAYILYQTSAVMRHYRTDQHVAAALALFAAVALMFWYILRLLTALGRR